MNIEEGRIYPENERRHMEVTHILETIQPGTVGFKAYSHYMASMDQELGVIKQPDVNVGNLIEARRKEDEQYREACNTLNTFLTLGSLFYQQKNIPTSEADSRAVTDFRKIFHDVVNPVR